MEIALSSLQTAVKSGDPLKVYDSLKAEELGLDVRPGLGLEYLQTIKALGVRQIVFCLAAIIFNFLFLSFLRTLICSAHFPCTVVLIW